MNRFMRFFRQVPALTLFLSSLVLMSTLSCFSQRETQVYETDESNLLLFGAITAKNLECGSALTLVLPLLYKADRDQVDFCVYSIMKSDCAAWASAEPTPESCQAIVVDF